MVYRDTRHADKARDLYQRALHIDEAKLGSENPRVENDWNNLGGLAFRVHDDETAEKCFSRSLELHRRRGAADTADEGFVMANLAAVYVRQDRTAEASDLYRRAIATLRSTAPDDPRLVG